MQLSLHQHSDNNILMWNSETQSQHIPDVGYDVDSWTTLFFWPRLAADGLRGFHSVIFPAMVIYSACVKHWLEYEKPVDLTHHSLLV
jgi:hypothetical protein